MQQRGGGKGCPDALVSPDASKVFPWACRAGFNVGFPAWLTGFIFCMPSSGMDPT